MAPLASRRPAVILLHASGSSSHQWDGLATSLQHRFRPLAVDLHGHGTRPAWDEGTPFVLADDAAIVTDLLRRLGGAYLVGHSYGGAVALKAASMRSELVHGIVAYEPVVFRALLEDEDSAADTRDVIAVAEWMRARLAANNPTTAARRFVEFWSGADAWRYLPPQKQRAIGARMPTVMRHFDALFDDPFEPRRLDGLPLLVLTGAETIPAAHRLGAVLAKAFPYALHEQLPEMGHMGPVTHAAPVNRRIEQFLDTHKESAWTRTFAMAK